MFLGDRQRERQGERKTDTERQKDRKTDKQRDRTEFTYM